jgi:hypothetical protein
LPTNVRSSTKPPVNGITAFGRGIVAKRLLSVASMLFKGARLSFKRRSSGE